MRHVLSAILVLALVGCSTTPKFRVLQRSSFTYPAEQPIKVFIAEERDRSGGQYRKEIEKYDLDTFRERIHQGLWKREIKVWTYEGGTAMTKTLINPFAVVDKATDADMQLMINVDGFEYGKVEVTRDRVSFWNGFGITTYVGYDVVPRVLVGISCTVVEMHLKQEVGDSLP